MSTMNINDMKDTLLFRDYEIANKMLKFIQNDLGIKESGRWNFIGYEVISVDPKEYERVLLEGRKYAIENDWGMHWVNCDNERRGPIASMDIGYGIITRKPFENEKDVYDRFFWEYYEEDRPQVVREYLDLMKDHLGEQIIRLDITYRRHDDENDAFIIKPVTNDIDYEKYKNLLANYISEYGYGPFEEIKPMTFTGKIVEEPFQLKKTK